MIKNLSFLVCSFISLIFITAQTFTVNDINYKVLGATTNVEVTNSCYTGALTIPSSVDYGGTQYAVTSIGDYAFEFCANLTSVIIPNTVTKIGYKSFSRCSNLNSVSIPNSVTSIGESGFEFCTNLTSIIIPDSITAIPTKCFARCSGLASITIPNSVTSIGESAFEFSGLTSISIPNSITSIPYKAFTRCTNLTTVTIPNSVSTIGDYAFEFCTNLQSVVIPESVISIGTKSFGNCTNLNSISCAISSPLTIGTDVFENVNQANCSLTVPTNSVSSYQLADVWKNFNPILGNPILSTKNIANQNTISIYPNPVHNETVLELKNSESNHLEIYDSNGRIILEKTLNNNTSNLINTSRLSNGIYLFKVGKTVTKVLKN
ncbi:leucine-rich repeat protein [Chryseobacterium sp. SNU WT5]|uniref:leucine-rich repeat domain-containing protein n=1 Tax=Chryseobacterium sp. SNU WT5 TaxID=2594269 RepID=UPI00117E8A96|nr:leucine-rich repeat domain-containing protein [Chryseobacterium sp. SNU WT5]QDP86509.1 leucine-rich repeat protein [Chryseobacterium sp. SNU WT5]